MEHIATTTGLYPLPDDAKELLADLKGHQKDDLIGGTESEAVADAYADARETVVTGQQERGLDRIGEGQLRWDDMLAHPLTVHDSVRTEGIVRYYDNNNFYREPVVEEPLDFDGDVAAELDAAAALTDDLQAVVPGPYSLSELAADEQYGDDAEFLGALGEFLAEEVAAFPDHELLTVLDPSLVVDPPTGDTAERASDAVDAVAAATDADVLVHTYWGSFEAETYAHLLDADIDAVGFDLVTAPEANAEIASEYGTPDAVGLGLVDGQNTLVESPETIQERADWFAELPGVDPERAYLAPNTELFYLPVNRCYEKLAALGTAADPEEVVA
jgi:5-methyltetrahydropteroyltriglutamate--homocysteine methyltransferase